jgi:hypothetical protein
MTHSFYGADQETHRRVIILAALSCLAFVGIVADFRSVLSATAVGAAKAERPGIVKAASERQLSNQEILIVH